MASSIMKGKVELAEGIELPFVIGPRERIKAERELNIKAKDMQNGEVGEEYLAFLIYAALTRTGDVTGTFDDFIDLLADYEVDVDPESQTPPAE